MNVYESNIKGLEEAIEYERGNKKATRTVTLELLDDGTVVRRDDEDDDEE